MANIPLEIVNKIIMMSIPKYDYIKELKNKSGIVSSKKIMYFIENGEDTQYNLINYIGWIKSLDKCGLGYLLLDDILDYDY